MGTRGLCFLYLCLHLFLLYFLSLLWTKDLGRAQTLRDLGDLPPRLGSVSLWFMEANPRLLGFVMPTP